VERANIFIVEDCPALWELADNRARLYNEVNFERRHAYICYKRFEWHPKRLYEKYAPLVGSATAQQIINKNNEAWKSFPALKRLEAEGRLPKHVTRVSMPRYWKKNGKRKLKIIVRNDCYKIDDKYIHLPMGLKLVKTVKFTEGGEEREFEATERISLLPRILTFSFKCDCRRVWTGVVNADEGKVTAKSEG